MKLQEVFDQLSAGEFSQLSIGGADAGVIDSTNYAKVLNHVNLGLAALYKRFNLKEGSLILQLQDEQTLYKLNSAYAVTGVGTEPIRYILDSVSDPFVDDIIKVEKVVTDLDEPLVLNDASNPLSVTTPSQLTLRVPLDVVGSKLTVVYRASHVKLVATGLNPNTTEVTLPDTHLDALLLYIASRVHAPVGMGNEFNASNGYYARYEQACAQLEGKGLQVDIGESNTRAQRGGWI